MKSFWFLLLCLRALPVALSAATSKIVCIYFGVPFYFEQGRPVYTESTYVLYVATKSIYLCIKINYQFCTVKLLQALAISIRIEYRPDRPEFIPINIFDYYRSTICIVPDLLLLFVCAVFFSSASLLVIEMYASRNLYWEQIRNSNNNNNKSPEPTISV